MCKYCDFDEPCGKQVGNPFPEGFGITTVIRQDRTFYSIVNTDGLIVVGAVGNIILCILNLINLWRHW